MVNITTAAEAFVAAFAAAIQLGGNTSVPIRTIADTVATFFLPNQTSFSLGSISIRPNESVVAEGAYETFLQYNKSEVGLDVRLEDSRVEAVSDQSAICWITWKIFPRNCQKSWDWTNAYGFRLVANRTNGLPGGWEWSIGDNEHEQFEAHVQVPDA